jgi:hypothetical protein
MGIFIGRAEAEVRAALGRRTGQRAGSLTQDALRAEDGVSAVS